MSLRGRRQPCYKPPASVPPVADQRLARAEQQHQENTKHAEYGKGRLIQHQPDHGAPEPRGLALHPGPERLLARLVDVVPELTETGEAKGLVGDPAGPVIDHEEEPAGEQQQPYQSEKAADHASPMVWQALCAETAITGARGEIQPHQPLIESAGETFGPEKHAKALTSEKAPSIRAPMAAGAIPPPLFFGQRPPPLPSPM